MSSPGTLSPPSWVRTAQATTIFLSAFTCGANLADSFLLIPRILESPTPLMVRQWLRAYSNTKLFFPAVLEPTAVVFYLLAWHFRRGSVSLLAAPSRLYLAAGLLCQAIGPYTWFVVFPTNRKIMRKVEETSEVALFEEVVEAGERREESAKWLVDHWGMLNLPRGIMMGVASILGLVATL